MLERNSKGLNILPAGAVRLAAGMLLGFGLLLAPSIDAHAQAPGSKLEQIRQKGSMSFGIRIDTPRFGGLNPQTNEITGFEIDLVQALSDELLGKVVKPELVPVTSQNRTAQLTSGRVDLLIATITVTEGRMKEVEFSNVYLRAGQSLLVRTDSTITNYKDLAGKKVCTVVGSTPEQTIRRLVPDAEVSLYNTYPECLISLRNGRVDAVTTGIMLLRDFHDANKDTTKLVGDIFTFEAWSMAARKEDKDLIEAVNAAMTKLKQNGTYKALYEKWIESPMPADVDSWFGMTPAEAARLFAESSPT